MRTLFTILALTLLTSVAEAQLNVPVAGLGSIQTGEVAASGTCADTVSGTVTCTYGCAWVQFTPLLGTASRDCWAFPGNTGPAGSNGSNGVSVTGFSEAPGANCSTGGSRFVSSNGTTYACNGQVGASGPQGPSGAAGPAGQDGLSAGGRYEDSTGDDVPCMSRVDSAPVCWDDTNAVYWQMDPRTGLAVPDNIGDVLYYSGASCTGTVFGRDYGLNRTYRYTTKTGTVETWGPVASYGGTSPCYGWSGSSCTTIACPSGGTGLVELGQMSGAPDLSGYSLPLVLVGD